MSSNWEDALGEWSAGTEEEETPIYTRLYLEYREEAFRLIGLKLQQEVIKEKEQESQDGN